MGVEVQNRFLRCVFTKESPCRLRLQKETIIDKVQSTLRFRVPLVADLGTELRPPSVNLCARRCLSRSPDGSRDSNENTLEYGIATASFHISGLRTLPKCIPAPRSGRDADSYAAKT